MELSSLNWAGIGIGICTFVIIGIFHPIVIKGEYYFGLKTNYFFVVLGISATIGALFVESLFWSSILAVVAFSSFWGIKEVYDQQERVRKGWFPANPKRKNKKSNS